MGCTRVAQASFSSECAKDSFESPGDGDSLRASLTSCFEVLVLISDVNRVARLHPKNLEQLGDSNILLALGVVIAKDVGFGRETTP